MCTDSALRRSLNGLPDLGWFDETVQEQVQGGLAGVECLSLVVGSGDVHGDLAHGREDDVRQQFDLTDGNPAGPCNALQIPSQSAQGAQFVDFSPSGPTHHRRRIQQHDALDCGIHRSLQPCHAPRAQRGDRVEATGCRDDRIGDVTDDLVQDGVEECLLAVEVVVQAAPGHAGEIEHGLDGRCVVTSAAEQLPARADEPLAGCPALFPAKVLQSLIPSTSRCSVPSSAAQARVVGSTPTIVDRPTVW